MFHTDNSVLCWVAQESAQLFRFSLLSFSSNNSLSYQLYFFYSWDRYFWLFSIVLGVILWKINNLVMCVYFLGQEAWDSKFENFLAWIAWKAGAKSGHDDELFYCLFENVSWQLVLGSHFCEQHTSQNYGHRIISFRADVSLFHWPMAMTTFTNFSPNELY